MSYSNNELNIVFEDTDLLVINKPAGITVNRSQTTAGEKTVQDVVEEYLHIGGVQTKNEESEGEEEEVSDFIGRSGIVHRIDKETSGILLVAKNEESFVNLQAQFKQREVHKTYQALAHGRVAPEKGEINVPVGRLPWNRRQFGIVAGGRESVTFYEVMGYYRTDDKRREVVTMVKLKPITGRTHQIRVHLQYLGYPIFSDFLYAGRKTQREDRRLLERVFLHALEISFLHPRTNVRMDLKAPLPLELQKVMDHLVPIV
jgi:23S rRNA pseudouridine1911/1915/1917 synthase